ncbi:MAG TPA: diguanylate cyclase [Pseudothermotoga sp.]|nr:diguanylate cyclase [Pseudothermotoga sp.]HOK82981.1 diguanylate cyclase [Pseudothermotoga sp.]HPP69850.1 diguanylate cyclase [Pseudothermotoga sp.]
MVKQEYFRKSLLFMILMGLSILIFGFFVITSVFPSMNKSVTKNTLQEMDDKLNIAFALIEQHYQNYTKGFVDEYTAKNLAKDQLEHLFYGPEKLDYFWILNKEGTLVMHPFLKNLVGLSYMQVDDPVYKKTVENILKAVKENKKYVEYVFYKYASTETEAKISAVRVFEPWGWIVGTGYYRTTLLTKMKDLQNNFMVAIVIFFGLLLTIYIAFFVQYRAANREISRTIDETKTERDRLRTLIEMIPQPVALLDKNETLLEFNRAYSEIQNFISSNEQLLCFESASKEYHEISVKTEKGLKWYSVRCIPISDRQGNVEGFIHLYSDITPQKLQIMFWQDKARQDPLTGLANRNTLEELVDNFPQLGDEFSVIMMDIDGFKAINDTYGHLVGDSVLVRFAEILRNSVRRDTFIIRYGGDEFLLIMPQTTREVAKNLIERLRKEVQKPFKIGQIDIQMSFCAGIAAFPEDGRNLKELIHRADQALYAAKMAGKNNIGS